MKKLIVFILLSSLSLASVAGNADKALLSAQCKKLSEIVAELIILPKQPLSCGAKFLEASTEIFSASELIKLANQKPVKMTLMKSVHTLSKTEEMACLGGEVVSAVEFSLFDIMSKL